MAQHQNRSNHVRVDNLPPNMTDCRELLSQLELGGNVQDLVAISPTSVVASYQMRMMAEQAVFALNGATLASSGNQIAISLFFPQNDPQFGTNPALQRLGQYIGQDHVSFDPANFQPWTPTQPGRQVQQQQQPHVPFIQQPVPNPAAQQFGLLGQQLQQVPSGQVLFGGGGNNPFLNNLLHNYLPLNGAIFGSNPPPPAPANAAAANPPPPSDTLSEHTRVWQPVEPAEQCTICLGDMDKDGGPCRQLNLCPHHFHSECLNQMLMTSPSPFLQCPICKKVHGVRTGNRPINGNMRHGIDQTSLPGHEGSGTITIHFSFRSGVQGPEHPSPGQAYTAHNFPRQAYLPDTPDGCRALHGLYLAWEQRLLFTVGTSMTTGQPNCVTWNDIHLKTHRNGPNHSYPDPNFLTNLMQELAGFGITEAEIGAHMTAHPNLRTRGKL